MLQAAGSGARGRGWCGWPAGSLGCRPCRRHGRRGVRRRYPCGNLITSGHQGATRSGGDAFRGRRVPGATRSGGDGVGHLRGMHPEPVTAIAPRAARPALLRQDWRDVTLLHWPLDPAVAAPLLPPGTRPDELDGRTLAGLVPLEMRDAPPVAPPLPWLGTFAQANVRLYSVDREGRRGVVFLSLDAGRVLPALTARVAGLPYWPAGVRVGRQGGCCGYRVDRRPGGAHASIDLRIGPRRDPGPLDL